MGKKHKHPEHENLERWLVSYADFITLLFATFVVLYALSQADLAKFKEFSKSVQSAFNPAKSIMDNPGGVLKGTPEAKILDSSGNSILDKVMPKFPENAQPEGSTTPLSTMVQDVNKEINALNVKQGMNNKEAIDQTQLKLQERGIVISFSSSLFFNPGQAGIKPEAFGILDKVAGSLKDSGRVIHVEGHTDSAPISTAVYPSNWELSAARASSVIRYFTQKHKFDPKTLAAVGYAHTRPIASNKTAEGRSKNRRVDIVILFSSAVEQADAGAAQKKEKIVISSEGEGIGIPGNSVTTSSFGASKPSEQLSNEGVIEPPGKAINVIEPLSIRPKKPNIFKEEEDHPEPQSKPAKPHAH